MAKGIKKLLKDCISRIHHEMSFAEGRYGKALASEGYAGGYRDALADVLLLLNGVKPNSRYWRYEK